ncbi:MAG TPA: TIR domain-containing protein [Pyrinomonadaceae bacterium]
MKRHLKVFLCHSSVDKIAVRHLYFRLRSAAIYIAPWLDREDLLPGQRWEDEISLAVRNSDIVLVCLSKNSIRKTGYVQKEIKDALDVADRQPEGSIFLIPVKLEECQIPYRLSHLHYVNLFETEGFNKLMRSLVSRANDLGIELGGHAYTVEERREFIIRVIAEELVVNESDITPQVTLENLGGDGFDAIDIETRLEDFGIELTDEDAEGLSIVNDIRETRPGIGA